MLLFYELLKVPQLAQRATFYKSIVPQRDNVYVHPDFGAGGPASFTKTAHFVETTVITSQISRDFDISLGLFRVIRTSF